jgi:hypothetical protein
VRDSAIPGWRSLPGLAAIAWMLVGCYEPRYGECVVRCAAASDCAPGQACGADGWCVSPEHAGQCASSPGDGGGIEPDPGRDGPRVDAGKPPKDARLPDAPPPDGPLARCGAGCPGTCEGGVCVIACSGTRSCEADVICPVIGACRVECTGRESCRGEIICGAGRCTVACSGDKSCRKGTQCASSCACDVACTGIEACGRASMCPDDACRAGKGCTSQPSGCDSC